MMTKEGSRCPICSGGNDICRLCEGTGVLLPKYDIENGPVRTGPGPGRRHGQNYTCMYQMQEFTYPGDPFKPNW